MYFVKLNMIEEHDDIVFPHQYYVICLVDVGSDLLGLPQFLCWSEIWRNIYLQFKELHILRYIKFENVISMQ